MGVNLFMHSVRLVLGDWRNALRITGLLYLIYAVPALLLGMAFPPPSQQGGAESIGSMLALAPGGIIVGLLALVMVVWIAVAWHRYILLDEVPTGQVPAFNQDRMLAYAGYSILLGLILLVVSVVVSIVLSPLVFLGAAAFGTILSIVVIAVALVVDFRLGLVLPAKALGKPLTFGEAWQATKGETGTILVLAIVAALAAVIIDIPAMILAVIPGIGNILSLIWTLGTGWVKAVVGVSLLTTLYGYYIEKRNIPA
ncbi:MAG: hypothetical protein ACTHLT_15150 [Devosia sp.]